MRYCDQDIKTTMQQTKETTVSRENTNKVNTPGNSPSLISNSPSQESREQQGSLLTCICACHVCAGACRVVGGCKLPNMGTWMSSNSTYLLSSDVSNLRKSAPNGIGSPTKLSEGNRLVFQVKAIQECQVSTAAETDTNTVHAKDELSVREEKLNCIGGIGR